MTRSVSYLLLFGFALFVLFFNLGANSLHMWDESLYAMAAEEMATEGSWHTLTLNGEPFLIKGPLKFWLTAATYKFFGVNEWTTRIWSALFAFGTIVALSLLGDRIFGFAVGSIAGLILLTSHQFVYIHCARTGDLDSSLVFFWTLAMLLLLRAIETRSSGLLVLCFVSVGLCGLTKHSTYVPVVLLVVALYVILTGAWRIFPLRSWLWATAVLVLIVLPWDLVQVAIYGFDRVAAVFSHEIFERAAKGLPGTPESTLGPWYYLVVLKDGMFPWSLLLPFALFHGLFRSSVETRQKNLLFVLWIALALAVHTLSAGKIPRYILVAYPAVALLAGQLLDQLWRRYEDKFALVSVLAALVVALLSSSPVWEYNPFSGQRGSKILPTELLGALGVGAAWWIVPVLLLGVWLAWRWSSRPWVRGLVLTILVGLAVVRVTVPLRLSGHQEPIDTVVAAVLENRDEGDAVWVAVRRKLYRSHPVRFYLGRLGPDLEVLKPRPAEISQRLQVEGKTTLIVTTPEVAAALDQESRSSGRSEVSILATAEPYQLVEVVP